MEIVLKRRIVRVPILPVVALVAVVALALAAVRIGRVQPSQIGVFVNNLSGDIQVRMQPGAVFYNGLLSDFYILDNSVQTIRMVKENGDEVRIKTDDGSDVTMDVEVNYRLLQNAKTIEEKVIPESGLAQVATVASGQRGARRGRTIELVDAYKAKWVRDYARSVVRYAFGELDTKTFYNASERDQKTREAQDELNRLLNPHGIEVRQVVPDTFRFIEAFENIIAETQTAQEEVESQQRKAEAALEDQKKQEEEARAKVKVEIASIKGELDKAVLTAEADAARETKAAEAYAYSAKQEADAAFYKADNEAKSILVKATAEAQGMTQLAASLAGDGGANLVKLEYAKALGQALISGLPYSTDPTISKVEVADPTAAAKRAGAKR